MKHFANHLISCCLCSALSVLFLWHDSGAAEAMIARYSALHVRISGLTVDLSSNTTICDVEITGIEQPIMLSKVSLGNLMRSSIFWDADGRVWQVEPVPILATLPSPVVDYTVALTSGTNSVQVRDLGLLRLAPQRGRSRRQPNRLRYIVASDVSACTVSHANFITADANGRGEVNVLWIERGRRP